MEALSRLEPMLLSLLRVMAGLVIFEHGTAKFINLPVHQWNNASISNIYGVAGIFELVGGLLLVIGLFTRFTAFILSGFTAAAYFYAHAPKSFYPLVNGGELAILFCFIFLFLAAAGGGPISVDRLIRQKG